MNRPTNRLATMRMPSERWPAFTEEQVAFLEARYPARTLQRDERVEDHLRYAGMVELIGILRQNVDARADFTGTRELEPDAEETLAQARARTQEIEL